MRSCGQLWSRWLRLIIKVCNSRYDLGVRLFWTRRCRQCPVAQTTLRVLLPHIVDQVCTVWLRDRASAGDLRLLSARDSQTSISTLARSIFPPDLSKRALTPNVRVCCRVAAPVDKIVDESLHSKASSIANTPNLALVWCCCQGSRRGVSTQAISQLSTSPQIGLQRWSLNCLFWRFQAREFYRSDPGVIDNKS